MKRKITNDLLKWKNNNDKKAFLLLGARQVGKTYSIRDFGKTQYKNLFEINFEIDSIGKRIFETAINYEDLVLKLSSYARSKNIMSIKRSETLIFFDEIQGCPQAITFLKFLVENGDMDVVASGSLLGVSLKKVSSYRYSKHIQI